MRRLLWLLIWLTSLAFADPPKRFSDQRQAAAQADIQDHFRQMVNQYLRRDAGYEFAAHRSLGDPALLYGNLARPDGKDHFFEVFVVDGRWRRRQWTSRRVVGTRVYSDWAEADASQFCDGNHDGSTGWEASTPDNGDVALIDDFVIVRNLFDKDETCWHECNHAALFRGGPLTVAAGPDGDEHHSYIVAYAQQAVQEMAQLRKLEELMAAVPATTTPLEEQQAWAPIYVRWRNFVKDWETVNSLTPAQKQEYRSRTGVWFDEPPELARAYASGRCMGKTLPVKPPAWVFAEGGELVTYILSVDPTPEGPFGDRWLTKFDIISPLGRTVRGRPDRGTLSVTLLDKDPAAHYSVTGGRGTPKLAEAVEGTWSYDLAGDATGAEGPELHLEVDDPSKAFGRELHFLVKYSGARDPKDPQHSYAPCEARLTVKVRKLTQLKISGPTRTTGEAPLNLRVAAVDEKGQPVVLEAASKPRFRWNIFQRYDYEGERIDIPPRPARLYDLRVALFVESAGKERQVAEGTFQLTVEDSASADLKSQAEAVHRRLQSALEWLDELLALDKESLRLLERQCAANHTRQLMSKNKDQYAGMNPLGAANALKEDILHEQLRLKCMQRPTEEHHQHQADLKATRGQLESSRLAGGAFQEYAGLGDYAGYLKVAAVLEQGFKVTVPKAVPRPATLPWTYGLACGGDVGGVAQQVTVKLTAAKLTVKPGEVVALTAEAGGGLAGYTYRWSLDPAASGPTFSFSSQKSGRHELSVTVTDRGGKTATARLILTVARYTAKVELAGTPSIVVGGQAALTARLWEDGKAVQGDFVYRWQPHPEVAFSALDSKDPSVKATFPRPGKVDVWVQVLREGATLIESAPITVNVLKPGLRLSVSPAQPRVGQEARVRLLVTPDSPAVDVRWQPLPAQAVLLKESPRELTFYVKDARPLELVAAARTPHYGDDLGETRLSVTALPYRVALVGPKTLGPIPKVWKEGVGLVDAPGQLAVGQSLSFQVGVTPAPDNQPLRFRWTASEGCSLSNPASSQPTVTCSQVGSHEVAVEVSDSRDVVLGRGAASFKVALKGGTSTEAARLLKEGKLAEAAAAAIQSGDARMLAELGAAAKQQGWREHLERYPEEAVRHLELAVRLLPGDADAVRKLATARKALANRAAIEPLVARAHQLLENRRLWSARELLLQAEKIENSTPGQQSPAMAAAWGRLHIQNTEYTRLVSLWEERYGQFFRELDWAGALADCARLRAAWELLPASEARVASAEQHARALLAEQQAAWSDTQRIDAEWRAGRLSNPSGSAARVEGYAQRFGAKDTRRQACLDLAAQMRTDQTQSPSGSRIGGTVSAGSQFPANCKGNVFAGGTWCNARNGSDWLQLDFDVPRLVQEIRIQSASTDVSTEGARIVLKLQTPAGDWVVVEDLRNTNINRTQLSGGGQGRSLPPYRKVLTPGQPARAFRLELAGHGWFGASDIQLLGSPWKSTTVTTPIETEVPVQALLENRSGENVHIVVQGQSFGPDNRLTPGSRRLQGITLRRTGRVTFVAGRNGQTLATGIWDGDPDHPTRYPHVIWDGRRLNITTGLR